MSTTACDLLKQLGPLIEVSEIVFILCISRDSIYRLVYAGTLRAVDIGTGEIKNAIRVYRVSLLRLLAGNACDVAPVSVAEILPHSRPTFLLYEMSALLGCTDQHVRNLAKRGEITPPEDAPRAGRFSRASVIDFLTRREIK